MYINYKAKTKKKTHIYSIIKHPNFLILELHKINK